MLSKLFGLLMVVALALAALALPAFADDDDEEEEMSEGYIETVLNDVSFAEAKQRVTEALASQGFAVLTEIDLQAKFKEKLGKDIPPYTILGACNAGFGYRAWEINDHVGVVLPCNVVLEQEADDVIEVLFRDPRRVASDFDPALKPIADEAYLKILAVIEALGAEVDEEDDDEMDDEDDEDDEDAHAGHSH